MFWIGLFVGLIVGAVLGATVGVVAFGALLATLKSEVPVLQLQVPEDWREREWELRRQ